MDGIENPTIIRQDAKKYLMAIFRHFHEMTDTDLDRVLGEIQTFWNNNLDVDRPFDFNKIWKSMIKNNNQHWMNYRHDDETLNLIHYAKLLAQYHFDHILTQNIPSNPEQNFGNIQKVLEDFFTTHNLRVPTEQETRECLMDLGLYVYNAVLCTIPVRSQ